MKTVNNLTKATIKNYPMFNVREDLNFEDDGNHFKGFDYKGILPITTIRSDGNTYLSIRVDYMDDNEFTYEEWRNQPEYKLCDAYNGVQSIDMDKLVENCESILQAINRLNDKVSTEIIDVAPIKEALNNELNFVNTELANFKNNLCWYNLSDYELRRAKECVSELNRYIDRINDTLNAINNSRRHVKKYFESRLNSYKYIIIDNNNDYTTNKARELIDKSKSVA